jgi:hypothetical protein
MKEWSKPMKEVIQQLNEKVAEAEGDILSFFRQIVAIPSMDSDIEAVGQRVGEEMTKLGFDEVYVDKYGSIIGRIGSGDKILLFDSHLDTVGIGDPSQWQWDPFEGNVVHHLCDRSKNRQGVQRDDSTCDEYSDDNGENQLNAGDAAFGLPLVVFG